MTKLINISNPDIVITAPDDMVKEVGGNCWQINGSQPLTFAKSLWRVEKEQETQEFDVNIKTMEVFKPLAGTDITDAVRQAIKYRENVNKNILLAFNGSYLLINDTSTVNNTVNTYYHSLGESELINEPQGLDEAAKEWSEVFISEECKDACNYGFRVGAKWMAKQGVSKEMVISKLPNGDTFFSRSIEFDEVGVPNHTEVIVQIRKK